jgi:hypothetical protein
LLSVRSRRLCSRPANRPIRLLCGGKDGNRLAAQVSAARDIYEVAGREYGWAASTVKTMLRRLVEKGFLTYTQGNSYLYRPARQPLKSLGAADALLANASTEPSGPAGLHGEEGQPVPRRANPCANC